MKLTVIGCHGPYTLKEGEATSCYYVQTKDKNFALDFGSGAIANLGLDRIKKLDYIFLSHLHFDHTSDMLTLRYLLNDLGKKITVITEKCDSEWYKLLTENTFIEVINVQDKQTISLGDVTLSFFRTKHPMDNLGVRLSSQGKTLVYTGDTSYYDGIENDLVGADLVLIDACQNDTFKGPHLRAVDAILLKEKVGGKFVLTHKNKYDVKVDIEGIFVADEFAEYEV
ncbi:MAG: MBL fold metallo-hydrolase [Clostridia bacterium]|nr:MBL fold metallo-hydrolase [Clostridia bacterium]MDY5264153.1 MBL fold metallo-hydrolase [Eubacteriales bacterium]